MDRRTIYYGEVPQVEDLLTAQQSAMVALAKMAEATLGTANAVDGFQVTPTTPAGLNVILTAGQIYQVENLEATAWSALNADTSHSIFKQGILLDPVTIGITPPTTLGYSQVFIVEVQYQDTDTGATVEPYYNATTPSQPFSGPGNAGSANFTMRKGAVAYQVKAGIPAASGTQVAPTPDAGWTGLYFVTVANGATTITSGNITQYTAAPFIPVKLPGVPAGVQGGQWVWGGTDTGTANAVVVTLNPVPTQLIPGMAIRFKKSASANTGAVTFNLGLGANSLVRNNLAACAAGDLPASCVCEVTWDGANWQLTNFQGITATTTNNNTYTISTPYAVDSSVTPNQVTAAFSPAITSLSAGQMVEVKIANTNNAASTITVNALSPVNIVSRSNQQPLAPGAMRSGMIAMFIYDGTNFQHIPAVQQVLTQALTVYVRTTGSDLNNGSSNDDAHAFATVQGAITYITNNYYINGQTITIQLGVAGTYNGLISLIGLPGPIIIKGNVATPTTYILLANGNSGTQPVGVVYVEKCKITLQGLTINNSCANSSLASAGLRADNGADVTVDTVAFDGSSVIGSQSVDIYGNGGQVTVINAVQFLHNVTYCVNSTSGNVVFLGQQTTTVTLGTITVSAFAAAADCGTVWIPAGWVTFINFAGVSGSKFTGILNGIINVNGGGVNFLPGNSAGTLNTGGQIA